MAGGDRAELEELRRLDALESRAGSGKPPQEPAFESEAREIINTDTPSLIAANPMVRMATSAARPFLGGAALVEQGVFGTHSGADRLKQLDEMQARGSRALGFNTGTTMAQDVAGGVMSPLTGAAAKVPAAASKLGRVAQGAGIGGVAGLTSDPEHPIKEGAKGAAGGGLLSGVMETLLRAPGAIGRLFSDKPKPRAQSKPGEGAEKVTGELQRQRAVQEGQQPAKTTGGSQYERESTDFENRMRDMREASFREGTPVEAAGAIDTIRQLEAKNPDAKVRAALKEVRQTIARAADSYRTSNLPAAGARITPQQFASMHGQGTKFDVAMADEVRQSINRMIEGKGDAALDAHTKEVLSQVRDRLMAATPESYRKYVAEYAKGAQKLEPFKPEHGPSGKLTSADRAAQPPKGVDAQRHMNEVLQGKDSARNIAALVRDTKHDPEVMKGLRQSVSDWMIQRDAIGQIDTAQMLTRWRDARQAIQESEMFDPKHFADVDKLMIQLKDAARTEKTKRTVGSTLGWFIGGGYKGSYLGRHIAGKMADSVQADIEQRIVDATLESPEVAAALVSAPTEASVAVLERVLSAGEGMGGGRERKPEKKAPGPNRTPSPAGMHPKGVPMSAADRAIDPQAFRKKQANPGAAERLPASIMGTARG